MIKHKISFFLLFCFVTSIILIPSVKAETTFGDTGIGGTPYEITTDYIVACKFTAGSTGDIFRMSFYGKASSGSVNTKVAIYSDNAGAPNAKLAESSAVAISTTAAWRNYTISCSVTASSVYWLAVIGSGSFSFYYDGGSANQFAYHASITYPTFPDPFGASSYGGVSISIYAVYEDAQHVSFDLTGTVALTSSLSTQKALTKTLTETIVLSDGSTVTKTKTVSNTETVTTETTFSDQKAVTSTTMEYVNLTSSLESTKSVSETLVEAAETANLESTLTTSKGIFASIGETINLNSLMEATKHIGATLVELTQTLNLSGVLESISSALSSDEWFAAGAIIALVVVCPFLALFVLRRRLN